MHTSFIDRFHAINSSLDHGEVLRALIGVFRDGNIAVKARQIENKAISTLLSKHHSAWHALFPPFPKCPFPSRTPWQQAMRGRRDAYLKKLIVETLQSFHGASSTIVNPVDDFGTHARNIARSLPTHEVIATDIAPTWNRLYSILYYLVFGSQRNYSFVRESIFKPEYGRRPCAVVFFGACGSLTDACIDYAIAENSSFLVFRACCHEIIGNNTDLTKYSTLLNYGFRVRNYFLNRLKTQNRGFYFSDEYGQDVYPRSALAREISDSREFHEIAKSALDSDVCRCIIDLDRCLFLHDSGYDVLYKEELFFAISRKIFQKSAIMGGENER